MSRRPALTLVLGALIFGCGGDFDTTRNAPPRGSVGRELYSLVCDRVGAQSLREDVTGASFHALCHPDENGKYAEKVDVSWLVPLDPNAVDEQGNVVPMSKQEHDRGYSIARVEALARRREDLVAAFDATMPDVMIDVKTSQPGSDGACASIGARGKLLEKLAATISSFVDLYNDETIPYVTRGLGKIMRQVQGDAEVQAALARFDARQGYRPAQIAIGVARPAIEQPRLVDLVDALTRLLGTHVDPVSKVATIGSGADDFQTLLTVLHHELRTTTSDPPLGSLSSAPDTIANRLVLSRPRSNLEISRTLLLDEADAFALSTDTPKYIVSRDARAVAAVPLVGGKVPAPFVDVTGPSGKPDGLPDLDALGRFVTTDGKPVPSPFFAFDATDGKRDVFGRALDASGKPLYAFVDTTHTFAAALVRNVRPLVDPNPKDDHQTVMNLLAGAPVIFGTRDATPSTTKSYPPDPAALDAWNLVHPNEPPPDSLATQPVVVRYKGFHPDDSPIVDLVYALGQTMADPAMDDALQLFQKLLKDHPNDVARVIGLGLRLKKIADAHPEAHIPQKSTLWDEMLDTLAKMAATPGIFEDLIKAFDKDDTVKLAPVFAAYTAFKDELSYNPLDLNGPALNLTTGVVEPMKTPVDRSKPDTGDNRSELQRFMQLLHDANGLAACTKDGAIAHVNITWSGIPIQMDYPTDPLAKTVCAFLGDTAPDRLPACGVLRIENVAALLLDVALDRAKFDIRDKCLADLANSPLTALVGGVDAFLQQTSGIDGFDTHPTVNGVARMTFFDTAHDGLPGDTHAEVAKTKKFLEGVLDPVPSMVCPETPFPDSDGTIVPLRTCASFADTLRGRDHNGLFPLEELGFIPSVRPLAAAFADHGQPLLFVQLFDTMHLHWGSSAQTKDECDPSLPKTDARWCTQDGAVSYEALLAEYLNTDLFQVIHDFTVILESTTISHCDAIDPSTHQCTKAHDVDGVSVLAEAARVLVDPEKNIGLTDRHGNAQMTWNDGTTKPQVTPIYLLVDALKGIDQSFDDWKAAHPTDDRLTPWRKARSQIVDQLFTVDGTGTSSTWHEPSIPQILPVLIDVVRAQVFAHCPDRSVPCTWAKTDLAKKLSDVVAGPTFASVMDVLDDVRNDDAARTEILKLLDHLLDTTSTTDDAQPTTLAAAIDMLQVLDDDTNLTPLWRVVATATSPAVTTDDGTIVGRGLADASIQALSRIFALAHDESGVELCNHEIDPNRTIDALLKNLLQPMANGQTPIEVVFSVIADVNRADPNATNKLTGDDYANIAKEIGDFCLDPSRGLEQVYEVIREATVPR